MHKLMPNDNAAADRALAMTVTYYLSNTGRDTCLYLLQKPLHWLENMNDCEETTEPVHVCAQPLMASFFKLKLWAVTSRASNMI